MDSYSSIFEKGSSMSLNNSNIAVIVGSANKELGHNSVCKLIGVESVKIWGYHL